MAQSLKSPVGVPLFWESGANPPPPPPPTRVATMAVHIQDGSHGERKSHR